MNKAFCPFPSLLPCILVPANVVTILVFITIFLIALFRVSVTNKFPLKSKHIPIGELNNALVPVPFKYPAVE